MTAQHHVGVRLDDAHFEKLKAYADARYVKPGTSARAIIMQFLDDLETPPALVAPPELAQNGSTS